MTPKNIPTESAPVEQAHLTLSDVPPLADIPESARAAVVAWQESLSEAKAAGERYLAAHTAYGHAVAQRQYERDRALALGEPEPAFPELDELKAATVETRRLNRRTQHLHDDAARALYACAAEGQHMAETADHKPQFHKAIEQVAAAAKKIADQSDLVDWWKRVQAVDRATVGNGVPYTPTGRINFNGVNCDLETFQNQLTKVTAQITG